MSHKAAVWTTGNGWVVDVCDMRDYRPGPYIETRCCRGLVWKRRGFNTHAEALEWAIQEVGLAPPTHRYEDTNHQNGDTP
ncbi:MAG: hypothetical protein ACTH9H_13140 [Galactobacter sp.]